MSQAISTLRLVTPARDTDPLVFERRRSTRRGISGRVTAVRSSDTKLGLLPKICAVELSDFSDTGLGAHSAELLEPGSRITVLFPPHGPDGMYEGAGTVVRCQPTHSGFDIGIRFDDRFAA